MTEYGIADLRGRTDEDVATMLVQMADSRFQEELLQEAQRVAKIARRYRIPDRWRGNRPDRLDAILAPYRARGLFPSFPFGKDLTHEDLLSLMARTRAEVRPKSTRKTVAGFVGRAGGMTVIGTACGKSSRPTIRSTVRRIVRRQFGRQRDCILVACAHTNLPVPLRRPLDFSGVAKRKTPRPTTRGRAARRRLGSARPCAGGVGAGPRSVDTIPVICFETRVVGPRHATAGVWRGLPLRRAA